MLTQQKIVKRLNQLTLKHNLTWDDVEYDADKAVARINAYMGTLYPGMSEIMTHSEATYSLRSGSTDIPIFPDEYIHSIVIPYIATEVLARDEEFTTIYNKYVLEIEDGLFTMFQKEFNRVPLVFRQNPEQGVFFAADTAQGVIQRNDTVNLPIYKFRVHYHVNNSALTVPSGLEFVEDTHAYEYGESATVLVPDPSISYLSEDGALAYTFSGWSRGPSIVSGVINGGAELTVHGDIHLYALWDTVSTLDVDSSGLVSIKEDYAGSLTYLRIPDVVNNVRVIGLDGSFVAAAEQLQMVVLPRYLETITGGAFIGFQGHTIVIQNTPIETGVYPGLTIGTSAFGDTPNLTDIIIPRNVTEIASGAFPVLAGKSLTIRCRYIEDNEPDGWVDGWYADSSGTYTVEIVWGYNG